MSDFDAGKPVVDFFFQVRPERSGAATDHLQTGQVELIDEWTLGEQRDDRGHEAQAVNLLVQLRIGVEP